MSLKHQDRIYSSVKTLKSYGTNLSYDSDDEDKKKKRINKDNINISFAIDEYLKNDNCTLFNLGPIAMPQQCYTCSICNQTEDKYICKYCYTICHQICRDTKKKKMEAIHTKIHIEQKDYKGIKEFYCLCGSEYKHKPPPDIIVEFGPCDLIKLDEALKLENFFCETHKIQICCVCSVQCHNKCVITKTQKVITKSKRRPDKCLCKNECHTSYNEVAFTFPLNEYQKLSGVHIWPIQIMNILFKHKRTFHKLYTLFISMLNREDITEKEEKKFVSLLELFSNTFNRKFKTFYYHEDILMMFDYESLITYIPTIELNTRSNILLKFRLIFILLFVHLRKDFQTVKCLTSIDFLCSTVLERIEYKTILSKQNVYMDYIDKKYHNELLMEENHILKNIALNDICRLMEISIKYLDLEKHSNEFEIGLKYLCFILKKMMFTKVELIKLVHHLFIFFNKFYDYLTKKNQNIYSLLNIFNGLAEIVFMISVSYNDIVVMEYLNKYKKYTNIDSIKPIDDFIHVKSMFGNALYQIILKSCDILRRHYELIPKKRDENNSIFDLHHKQSVHLNKDINIQLAKNGALFPEKIVSLFTETLGIFSLADNIYYKQINSITKDDLIHYYRFINRIEKNKWIYFTINEKNEIDRLIFILKDNIESRFNNLFTSSYAGETLEINKKIYGDIYSFSDQIKIIINNLYDRIIKDNLNDKNAIRPGILRKRSTIKDMINGPDSNIPNNLNKETNPNINLNGISLNDSFINENRYMDENIEEETDEEELKKNQGIKKFWKKLSLKNNYYTFLKDIILNSITEELIDTLIVSNLDEVISKTLSFLSNRKYPNLLTYDLLDIIFSTMSLYFYTKRGMEYFLMGKNLTRLNKIINRFNYNSNNKNNNPELGKNIIDNIKIMNRTIDFLLDVCKGIKIYGLNIKNHKILHRLKKNLIEHISMFNLVSNSNLIEFCIHFKKIMKIFILLSNDYLYEEFKYIKESCILIIKKNPSNIFDKNIFFQIFYLVNNQKRDNQMNKNINIPNDNNKILLSLYFTFFRLITKKTFYIYNNEEDNEIIEILLSFNNFPEIKKSFNNNIFTLKQKYIILQYLRTICFIDHLDEYEILDQIFPLSNSEFEVLLRNNLIQTNINFSDLNNQKTSGPIKVLNNESQNSLIKKYQRIKDLEILLEIYLSEIIDFPKQIIGCDLKYSDLYYKELLFDIKYISNFFYCQKKCLWGEFKIIFYRITIEFLKNIDSFYVVQKQLSKAYKNNRKNFFFEEEEEQNNNYYDDENWRIELTKIDERMNQMQSISFDVYNKKKIYSILTESIDALIRNCGFNQKYNLQNFLEYYDVMAESNFTPFSLLETLDYEYFYDEKMEEDIELIKQDHYLFKLENLKNSFFSTFIDINNTNFLDVITSTSGENFFYDFRKKYINYFLSFINSIEGNHLHKLEINLCILTKMMFYNSEGMQNKFEKIVKDQYFFPNLNNILNKYMVLVFSLSKNIYAYELAREITNLNKLIIQFIQALGEGFNFTYHDNIFRFPKIRNSGLHTINTRTQTIDRFEEEKNSFYAQINFRQNYALKALNRNSESSTQIIALKKTIYESLLNNLKYALYKLDLDNMTDSELPYDKLIIFISNIIDFIIEYIDSTDDNNDIIKMNLKKLLLGTKLKNKTKKEFRTIDEKQIIKAHPYLNCFFTKIKPERTNKDICLLRKKVISYTKIKLTQLLIYYSLTGGKEAFIDKLVQNDFSTINLFIEILYNFYELINHLENKKPELIAQLNMQSTVEEYSNKLIDFYAYEEDFRNMIELQVIFQLFILIKIFEEIYKHNQLSIFFRKNSDNIESNIINESGEFNLRSKFSRGVYKFLQIIILKVEVKMDEEDKEEQSEISESENDDNDFIYKVNKPKKNKKNEKIARKIRGQLKNDKTFASLININKKLKNNNNLVNDCFEDTDINKINKEEEKTEDVSSSDITEEDVNEEEDEEKSNIKTMFFPRPYLTFFLSKSTKDRFINTVDRSSVSSKFNSLLNYADYCLYEMTVNKHLIGSSRFKNFCANIDYPKIEIINYIFIIVQNILILWRFYKRTDLSYQDYYTFEQSKVRKLRLENLIIAIVQECFLIVFLVTWYFYKFINSCQYYIMQEYNKPFVGKRIGEDENISQVVVDYFQEKNISTASFFNEVNKGVSKWDKFYVYVFSTHILNREINMLVLSLILNICYFATRIPLFLIFQILFVANISSTLFDIFYAIYLKWINIVLLLLFDFLCIYVFMWFYFFFFPYFFEFDSVIPASQEIVAEGFCYSSVQCYLFILSRGSLSNGGISNDLERISYKADAGDFIGRFFLDVLFFLLISLYIGKMFLSFIIDTFGELRNTNADNTNDKDNICFICQISRDDCLMKNIDFEKHIENVHNMWNYVYYLNYLYVNNPFNFNWIENSVWEKLQEQGINWLPLEED
jgi:hypothetical protein